jgi:Tfp pilus assembly protein PilF
MTQDEPLGWVLGLVALLLGGLAVGGFLFLQGRSTPAGTAAPVGRAAPAELSGPAWPTELAGLDTPQLQALVEADPAALAPRLRLAHRFLDASDHRRALEHYMSVLEQDPRNAEALSHAGWIAFSSGDVETAERMVRTSLEVQPDVPEALWFLANIRLYGRNDPQAALRVLQSLQRREDLTLDFRAEVDRLAADAAR